MEFALLHEKILKEKELSLSELQNYVAHIWENNQNQKIRLSELEKLSEVKNATDFIIKEDITEIKSNIAIILKKFTLLEAIWKVVNIVIVTLFGFLGMLVGLGIHQHILKFFGW